MFSYNNITESQKREGTRQQQHIRPPTLLAIQVGMYVYFMVIQNIQKKLFTIQLTSQLASFRITKNKLKIYDGNKQGYHKKAAQLYFHCGPLGIMIYQK